MKAIRAHHAGWDSSRRRKVRPLSRRLDGGRRHIDDASARIASRPVSRASETSVDDESEPFARSFDPSTERSAATTTTMTTERGAEKTPVEILARHFGDEDAPTIARQLSRVFERRFSFATLVEPLRAAQFSGVEEQKNQPGTAAAAAMAPRRMETHYARALKTVRASVLFLTSWVRADNVNVRDIMEEKEGVDERQEYEQRAAFERPNGAFAVTWRAICSVAERLWGAIDDVAHVVDMCAVCGTNDAMRLNGAIRENGALTAPVYFRELARLSIAAVVEDVAKRAHSTLIVATNAVMSELLGQKLGGNRAFGGAVAMPLAATPLFSRVVALDRADFIALGFSPALVVGFGVRIAVSTETGVAHIFVACSAPHLWLEGENELRTATNVLSTASFLCGREIVDVGPLELVANGWTRQRIGGLTTAATHGDQIRNGGRARAANGGLAETAAAGRLARTEAARAAVGFADLRATNANDLDDFNRTLTSPSARKTATCLFNLVHGLQQYGRGMAKFNKRRDRLPEGADSDEERAWDCFYEKHRSVNGEAKRNPHGRSQATKVEWDDARNALADIGNARRRRRRARDDQ